MTVRSSFSMSALGATLYFEKKLKDFENHINSFLNEPLSNDEIAAVTKEGAKMFEEQTSHEDRIDAKATSILMECFPDTLQPLLRIEAPLKQVVDWLTNYVPAQEFVMYTNMTGAFTIAYREFGQKRFLFGSHLSERGRWIKRRFDVIWPTIWPNRGRPFLLVVRDKVYYILEP